MHDQSVTGQVALFDMDGTLIDATPVIERIWTEWAARHDADVAAILVTSRGQRTSETVRRFARANADHAAEIAWLSRRAHDLPASPLAMPGAIDFIRQLPEMRWAIVTSAERKLAERWLRAAGIPLPKVLVAGDEVSAGKPDPAGYVYAATALDCDPCRAIVFEDAEAGVEAARRAGSRVVGIANPALARHSVVQLWAVDFTWLELSFAPAGDIMVTARL